MKCAMCDASFNVEDAEEDFEIEYPMYNYDNFKRHLCGNCAISVFEELLDDEYEETCEECGNKFDPILAQSELDNNRDVSGMQLLDFWNHKIVCADCALDMIDEVYPSEENF